MESIVEVIGVLIAICIMFFSGISIIIKLLFCTYEVQATVEKTKREYNTDSDGFGSSITYKAKCSYMYGGTYYTTRWIEVNQSYQQGNVINIYINPNNPKMAIHKHPGMYIQAGAFTIVAILIGCAAGPDMYSTSLDTYYEALEKKEEKAEKERYEKELAKANANRAKEQDAITPSALPTPEPLTTMERLTTNTKREYGENELGMRHVTSVGDVYVATPSWVTGPVYDGENDMSGKATFYYKSSGDVYARLIYVNHNIDINKAYVQLRNLVKKQGDNIKYVKTIEKKYKWNIEIYSNHIKEDKDEKKAYDYYAIAANKNIKIMVKHDGDLDEFTEFMEEVYD